MDITIVIPFNNGFQLLKKNINSFLYQDISYEFEILILNSCIKTKDDELMLLSNKIRVVHVDSDTFNHGLTRNLGVLNSNAKFLVYTVQDAKPLNNSWLKNLIEPMIKNSLHAICGKQIVDHSPKKNPIEWFNPIENKRIAIHQFNNSKYDSLPILEQKSLNQWDNVNAAYLRLSLIELPFDKLMFGEDKMWCFKAFKKGFKIAFSDFSSVVHYHQYNRELAQKRFIAEFYIDRIIYNVDPVYDKAYMRRIISILKHILKSKVDFNKKIFWFKYNIMLLNSRYSAYNFWFKYRDINMIEQYLINNIPQSLLDEAN